MTQQLEDLQSLMHLSVDFQGAISFRVPSVFLMKLLWGLLWGLLEFI